MATATATLEFSADNPVNIDWGDGSSQRHAAAPDGTTVAHTYASEGRWHVTIQDLVTFQRSRQPFRCPSCAISDANFDLTEPAEGSIQGLVNWTTRITATIGSEPGPVRIATPYGTSTYSSGVQTGQWSIDSPGGTMGPFKVTAYAADDPECVANVTGGNDPRRPGLDTFIINPILAGISCTAAPGGGRDRIMLMGQGQNLAWERATWTVDWGDGYIQHGVTLPAERTYEPPQGQTRTLVVTNEQTTARRSYEVTSCPQPPPPITAVTAGQPNQEGAWTPAGAFPASLAELRSMTGLTINPSTSWFDIPSFAQVGTPGNFVSVIWDGSQWYQIANIAVAGTPGTWQPAGTVAQPSFAMAQGTMPSPLSPWSSGQYVVLGDGSEMHFGNWMWSAGRAP